MISSLNEYVGAYTWIRFTLHFWFNLTETKQILSLMPFELNDIASYGLVYMESKSCLAIVIPDMIEQVSTSQGS